MPKRRNKPVSRKVTVMQSPYIPALKKYGKCPCGGEYHDNPYNADIRCGYCGKMEVKRG